MDEIKSDNQQNKNNWFYIKHLSTENVIASCYCESICDLKKGDCVNSQVGVIKPQYTDNELWCWEDHNLKNKSTGLVLDIRDGRLRLIEDTEICLHYKKPHDNNHNQLWAVQPACKEGSTPSTPPIDVHPLLYHNRQYIEQPFSPKGYIIYPIYNSSWALDIATAFVGKGQQPQYKLLLFPQHQIASPTQQWEFVADHAVLNINKTLAVEDQPHLLDDNGSVTDENLVTPDGPFFPQFAHGLSPAKHGGSHTSLSSLGGRKSSSSLEHDAHTISHRQQHF